MKSPSEPQGRVLRPWRGLLITASILSCWIQPMSAQVTIVPNPPFGKVNRSVTLELQGYTGQAVSYAWFRKAALPGQMIAIYTVTTRVQEPAGIREKVLPNGSLLISNLTLNDTDDYHVTIVNCEGNIIFGQGHLTVYERTTKPNLTANRTNIIENDTMDFTCGTKEKGVDILWFFNKKTLIFNERMKLSIKNRTLTILSVKRENIGSYQCEIRNPISSSRSDPFILHVNYGPDNITFVPKPEKGEIEVKFNDPLMLECHVDSYPPAQYIWQVNGTVNSHFSNNTYIIKSVTWENSENYTCLAKNNVTKLSVSKSITVKVVAQSAEGNSSLLTGGVITGIVIGVLAVIMLIGTLIYIHFRKTGRQCRMSIPSERSATPTFREPQLSENPSAHRHGMP